MGFASRGSARGTGIDEAADRRPADASACEFDAITRHRLHSLGLDPSGLRMMPLRRRLNALYRWFVQRIPVENLSNHLSCCTHPEEPGAWPRATDRFLREFKACGLGGTSFTLSYALRDLLRGLGANAHCTLGRNLVTEQAHAAVVAYLDDGPWLYDPALLTVGPLPIRPGGRMEDAPGTVTLAPLRGATLTVLVQMAGDRAPRPLYSLVPVPTPPQRFRSAWVASFCRGRRQPLRLARRVGDEIHRYCERPGQLEVLTSSGRERRQLGAHAVEELQRVFGIDASCFREWLGQ